MADSRHKHLLIWDSEKVVPENDYDVLLWQSYAAIESDRIFSVSCLVEKNSEKLRSQYLELVHDLGEATVDGKKVSECLQIRPGLSYWWMTLLTEKCNFSKSPQINNIIKLMAFESWFEKKNYTSITIKTANNKLAKAMRRLCSNHGIKFDWSKERSFKKKNGLMKEIFHKLPYFMQGQIWLMWQLFSNWSLRGVGLNDWKKSEASMTFVSYLFNLKPEAIENGDYESFYWNDLSRVLEEEKLPSNWLHLYVKSDLLPNVTSVKNIISRFNRSSSGDQVHVTLYTFISLKLCMSVCVEWFRLFMIERKLRSVIRKKSGFLWVLLKEDYLCSLIGKTAMSNILFFSLFEEAMSMLPVKQKNGFYLQENQGWEFGFIEAWRMAGHSNCLVGVPHSTVRFWDMRYFFDSRSYSREGQCKLPMPDCIAVNGEAAKKMFQQSGYPTNQLCEVEALRYLYLNDLTQNGNQAGKENSRATVLVLGDYVQDNTLKQMELLLAASYLINEEIQYIVKPHPACPIDESDYLELDLKVTNRELSALLSECSLAYTGSITSAAVDAYCAGKFIVTALDPESLNLSPLKGCDGVSFVSTPEELAGIINEVSHVNKKEVRGQNYFYLDSNLPKWKMLLTWNGK